MKRRIIALTATAALAALLLTGCAEAANFDGPAQGPAPVPVTGESAAAQDTAPAAPEAPAPVAAPASEGNAGIAGSADPNSGYIGEDAAKTTALTRAGLAESDVEAIRVRLDYDDGRAEYDVEFWLRTDTGAAEYDYEIDALTGEVLAFDYDAEDYDAAQGAQTPPAASGAAITAEEAKQIALEHAGVNEADIRALELETDRDDGRTVYEFSWKVGWTEYDYDIDAATGEILSFSQDVDD